MRTTKFYILPTLFLFFISVVNAQISDIHKADSILQTGDYHKALLLLEAIPNPSVEVLEKIATTYQRTGNNTKAITFFTRAYDMLPMNKFKEEIGNCYEFLGNYDKAISLYEEVLKVNPDNLLLKYRLAKLLMGEWQVERSITLLKELSEKDTLNPNYHYQLGVAYEKLGAEGFLKSGTSFLKAYKIDSSHVKSVYNLAKFFEQLKFKDSTLLFIDRGLKINPNSINFNQLKAKHSFFNEELDTALVYLKKLEDLNFKTKFTYKLYGLVYLNKEDYAKAEEAFKKAQKIDFKDPDVAFNLGLVYEGMKNYKLAELHFMMSIMHQKPDVDNNYLKLGLVQLEQNSPKKALISFEKGLENNSRNHNLLFQLALTSDSYYKDKRIALKHYENYIRRFEDKDEKTTAFVKQRIREIKKELFMDGESVD